MQNMGEDIMISGQDVEIVPRDMSSIYRSVSPSAQLLAMQLSKLPFGKKVLKDIPDLAQATWYPSGEFVMSNMRTGTGYDFIMSLSPHGVAEIVIRGNLNPGADQTYYTRIISLLQDDGVEAALSAQTKIEPFDHTDGFDLLISRLDTSHSTTRIGIAKLLAFLKRPE
jgi:hypothetical protein